MKSKLGVYVQYLDSFDVLDWAAKAKPRIMVSMDHNASKWRAIKKASPFTFVMGRHYFEDDEQKFDDPVPAAQRCFNAMLPEMQQMRGIYDCWMATNEPVIPRSARDEAKRLSLFYAAWGDLMCAAGFRSVAYSFGVGNPDLALWPYLLDGLRHCDFIGLHEYSAPTMQADSGWNCLRFPKVWSSLPEDAKRLIIIGECGIDGGVLGNAHAQEGWRKFGDVNQSQGDASQYLWSLRWYDDEIQLYPYVVGAAIFQGGPWGKDGSFGMGNEPAIRDYIGAEGDPAPFILRDRAFAAAAVLTRQFERFAATPTPDGKRFTIGYGHTIWPGESYTRITLIEAEALLVQDQHRFAQALERLVKVPLSDNQYGALLDFIYNVGVTAFGTSDLLRKLNAGDYASAAEEFARWKYGRNAKGEKVILPGLIKRRAAERELFLKT